MPSAIVSKEWKDKKALAEKKKKGKEELNKKRKAARLEKRKSNTYLQTQKKLKKKSTKQVIYNVGEYVMVKYEGNFHPGIIVNKNFGVKGMEKVGGYAYVEMAKGARSNFVQHQRR
ncbi:hypothetical protein JTB14_026314 [Gonioctena quinquepunctata]|nr:hypothetical protein JTB14_026314 [Gonioctena quinquepunctata]